MPLGQAVLTGANPMGVGRIALFIIGMIAIIAAAYYTTYFVGSKSFKLRSGRNIVLRDRFAVSKDKSFYVIEAYGKTYIVGVTNHSMTVIDTLDGKTVAEHMEVQQDKAYAKPGGAPARGAYQRMINGMAEFISTRVIKRGNAPRGGESERYNRGDDFGSVYKKAMSERDEETQEDTEDEE